MKRAAHFSIFATDSSEILRMLSTTCSSVRGWSRNLVLEKNLSAKQINCSSIVSGRKSIAGKFQPFCTMTSFVSPVPVWRSHTRA